jgi:hypothetical protein
VEWGFLLGESRSSAGSQCGRRRWLLRGLNPGAEGTYTGSNPGWGGKLQAVVWNSHTNRPTPKGGPVSECLLCLRTI